MDYQPSATATEGDRASRGVSGVGRISTATAATTVTVVRVMSFVMLDCRPLVVRSEVRKEEDGGLDFWGEEYEYGVRVVGCRPNNNNNLS